MVYLNAQSCQNKASALNDLVTDHDTDTLLLTETWLKERGVEAQKAEMTTAGYVLKSLPRKSRRGGSLAFLMKISLEKLIVIKSLSFSAFEAFEARVMYNSVSVTLICLYHSPYSKEKNNTNTMFLDEFTDFLHSLSDRKEEAIVISDFNFHFDIQHDSEVCKLKSLLNDCCLQQLVGQPNHRCGHTLDWLIVRDDSVIIVSLDVVDTALSYHRTVFCSPSLRKPGRVKQQVMSQNLRRIDSTRFQTNVSPVASSLAECPDCELLEELNASLRNVLDRHAPLMTPGLSRHARPLRGSSKK